MLDLYPFIRPLLFTMSAERAHHLTLCAMKMGVFPKIRSVHDPALEVNLWGLKFSNPVGLSAGFDKNGEVIGQSFSLGFGFIEAGTVTPKPQDGNLPPRIFRDVPNNAIINRMGFPNKGMDVFKANVSKFLSARPRPDGVVGINIGMNKTQKDPAKDYCLLIRVLGPMADYLAVNISSPNTPGLRDLQRKEPLTELLSALMEERKKSCGDHPPPLLVKLAPDLEEDQQGEIAAALMNAKIDGIILSNTTLARPDYLNGEFASEAGGLSGAPLTDRSTDIIRNFYRLTKGSIPIVGVGGISNGDEAYAKIKAGASLLQLYSSLAFQGPAVASCINKKLLCNIKADGYDNIAQAVGADVQIRGKKKNAK